MPLSRHGAINLGWQTSGEQRMQSAYGDFTFIVPTFNDATFAAPLLDLLTSSFAGAAILVVDDGSNDGTQDLIKKFSKKNAGHVNLLERPSLDRGLTASIMDAIDRCGTKHFIVLDPKARQPYEALHKLVEALKSGSDLALIDYNTNSSKEPWSERAARAVAHNLLKRRGVCVRDPMSNAYGANLEKIKPIIGASLGRFELAGSQFLFDLLKLVDSNTTICELELLVPNMPQRRMTSTRLGELAFIKSILK